MAIDLQPKTNYKLVSQDHFNQEKVIVHVKLTDSCLRALQGFKNTKGTLKHTPLIKFSGQNGKITIPQNHSTKKNSDGETQQFMFSCSTLLSHGCLDCIQQPSATKSVISLGSITHKINIMATDDSYKTTREKMKVVEEERKEIRTKVINTPSKGGKTSTHNKRQNSILKAVRRKMQTVPKSNSPSKSFRDRVIHLLAVKSFKKPELMDRLNKDGVSLKDKNALTSILQQVASVNNNQYRLLKHIYPEIKIDSWPYSDLEKEIVQRMLHSHVDGKNSLKKTDSNQVKSREIMTTKRPLEASLYANPVIKKQRISHVVSNNNVTTDSPRNPEKTGISSPSEKESGRDDKKLFDQNTQESDCTNPKTADYQSDYKERYHPITNHQQRSSYRRDFQVEYDEYIKLTKMIESVTKKFEELKGIYQQCPQESEEQKAIEKQVLELYQKHQQDPSWEEKRQRCRDLHCKLAYIKELIRDYDHRSPT